MHTSSAKMKLPWIVTHRISGSSEVCMCVVDSVDIATHFFLNSSAIIVIYILSYEML